MSYFENFWFSYNDYHKKKGNNKSVAREKPFFDYVMYLLGVLINRKFYYNMRYKLSLHIVIYSINIINSWL